MASAATFAVLLAIAFKILNLNYPDLSEGWNLAMAVRWSQSPPELSWLTNFPNTFNAYPPQFAWLVKTLSGWFPSVHPLLLGRGISGAAGFATATMIGIAVRQQSRHWADAWLGVLVFLTAPLVTQFYWQARVDPLAIFWTMAAYAVAAAPSGGAASALCLVAGSLAKQTVAFHALPLAIWFYVARRASLRAFILTGTSLAASVWASVFLAHEGFFWRTTVLFHVGKSNRLWHAFTMIYSYLPSAFMLAAMASAARIALTRSWMKSVADRWWVGFVFAAVVDSLLLMKDGSNTHYALTAVAFGSVLIGRAGRAMLAVPRFLAPTALALIAVVCAFPMFMGLRGQNWRPQPAIRQNTATSLLALVADPVVLTDGDVTPFVLAAGVTPMVADSYALRILADKGAIDLTPLTAALQKGRVDLVILDRTIDSHRTLTGTADQMWPLAILDAIESGYDRAEVVQGMHVYKPRLPSPGREK